jgi:hypothetical protein
MPRRKAPVLRNLDDPLKVFNLLSLRSCGLVLVSYALFHSLELGFSLFSAVFGSLSFLGELALAALVALGLALAERRDDEHLVPSAIRYYAGQPWRSLYTGVAREPQGRPGHGRS